MQVRVRSIQEKEKSRAAGRARRRVQFGLTELRVWVLLGLVWILGMKMIFIHFYSCWLQDQMCWLVCPKTPAVNLVLLLPLRVTHLLSTHTHLLSAPYLQYPTSIIAYHYCDDDDCCSSQLSLSIMWLKSSKHQHFKFSLCDDSLLMLAFSKLTFLQACKSLWNYLDQNGQ